MVQKIVMIQEIEIRNLRTAVPDDTKELHHIGSNHESFSERFTPPYTFSLSRVALPTISEISSITERRSCQGCGNNVSLLLFCITIFKFTIL
jgi:hypothetical protein